MPWAKDRSQPATLQRLSIEEGKKGIITSTLNGESSQIEVVATERKTPKGEEVVNMDFIISKINKDGNKTVLARPQIATTLNEPAQIIIGKDGTSEVISFSVLANKTTR